MLGLSIFTAFFFALSLIFNLRKTIDAVIKGLSMFFGILPVLLLVLIFVSALLFILPEKTLMVIMGDQAGIKGWILSAILGSVAMIPGFIAYPLCGLLVSNGANYSIIAVFITTLMMVGVVTLPIEVKFFGFRASIIRNLLSFLGALLIGFIIGLFL